MKPHIEITDPDSSLSVAYEDGYQVANKEWRKKIYKDGGEAIIKELLDHYKTESVIDKIRAMRND